MAWTVVAHFDDVITSICTKWTTPAYGTNNNGKSQMCYNKMIWSETLWYRTKG